MLNKLIYFFFILLFSIQINVLAQSPYNLNYEREGLVLGIGTIGGITSLVANSKISPLTTTEINLLNKNNINGFDRYATNYYSPDIAMVSNLTVLTMMATPALFLCSPEIRNDYLTVGTMYAETMLLAVVLPQFSKGFVNRTRPYAFNRNAPMGDKIEADTRRSFFSSHTTVAFASAAFISKVYSDYYPDSEYTPYILSGSMFVATTTGLLRIFSGKHFPTDVLTGAVVGSFIGWFIPELHKKTVSQNVSINVGIEGISICYMF